MGSAVRSMWRQSNSPPSKSPRQRLEAENLSIMSIMYKIIGVVKKISTTKMKVRCKNRRRCPISDLQPQPENFMKLERPSP
jgi:hypothetical protein